MTDVTLPSVGELAQMGDLPFAQYQQANDRIGLANQFANSNLQQKAADLQSTNLANLFSEQANPLKVQQLGLQNAGMMSDNISKSVKADIDQSTSQEAKAAKRKELLQAASDSDLKMLYNTAEQGMMSDDPSVAARSQKQLMASKSEMERRLKQADVMEKAKLETDSQQKVAQIHAGATLGAAQIGADARRSIAAAKNQAGDLMQEFGKLRTPTAQYSWLNAQAARADNEGNPELANKFRAMAEPLTNQVNAAYNSRGNPNAPDLNQMGVPTAAPVNVAPSSPAPKAAAAGRISVVSPDGKVGSIPANQLEAAMAAGYKKR